MVLSITVAATIAFDLVTAVVTEASGEPSFAACWPLPDSLAGRPQFGGCSLSHADLRAADARDSQASCTTSASSL